MSYPMVVFVGTFFLFFFLNAPIAFGLLVSSTVYLILVGTVSFGTISQKLVGGIDSFVLLAIPLFILAAEVMNVAGVTQRIFNFANSLVGHIHGGLAHAAVVASMIFAGMSGSAAADAAGLGLMQVNAMSRAGFDRPFSAALTAAAATIGPIIPPSIPMVVYGAIAQVSVGKLFLGGVIPGVVMGLAMMGVSYVQAVRRRYPRSTGITFEGIRTSFKEAILGLLAPVILLGGIYTGFFTPTEAAAVASLYALFLGICVYRNVSLKELKRILLSTVENTAIVGFIIGSASLFGWILTREQVPLKLTAAFLSISDSPWVMLAIMNIIFLILGCFMEINAIMLLFVPIFLPVVQQLNIDPVHFGLITVFNMMIGTLTPPFGMIMYIVTGIAKVPMNQVIRELWPFIAILIAVLVLITYVPWVVLALPSRMIR